MKFIKTIRQHGLNVAEKFGIISVVLTGGIILVNYMFGLHLSQYLRQIPLIGQLINIELIEEFEDIQDGDPFYEELKAHLALLNISEEDIYSIQVRKDSEEQETFKIITKDGKEQNIVVKKDTEDDEGGEDQEDTETQENYKVLKEVPEAYYRDDSGTAIIEDEKREIFVEVREREIYIEIPYTGDMPECKTTELRPEVSNESVVCEVCGASELPIDDRYDEGYSIGYDDGLVSCSATIDPNYDVEAAAALCQKSMDAEYQRGLTEGYQRGYDDGYRIGLANSYQEGYDAGYEAGSSDAYQQGYDAGIADGYTNGYQVGYTDGYDSCSATTGP